MIFPWFGAPAVTPEMIDRMPSLKIVSTISAGYNHLDVPMIKSKNVRVANTPGVLNDATAEQGIALMLAAARNTVIGTGGNIFAIYSLKSLGIRRDICRNSIPIA